MRCLLASQSSTGSYHRLAVLRVRKDGTFPVPVKLQGTMWSFLARNATKYLAAEPAAVTVFIEHGSFKGRVDRIVEK